uniref:DNA replication complex GINS protein PSF1 n=1 Tax=Steinernema glaseri TaxID=37863 RepID=A0A1I8AFB6_9BILA
MALKGAEACCDNARQLLIDLQRNPDFIPPYNDERMRKCVETINDLYRRNAETFQMIQSDSCPNPDETAAILQVQNEILKRIKQCVLVYHRDRLERLRKLRWTIGGVLPVEIKANLSEAELDWFNEYNRNLAEYQNQMNVDLMRGMEPPKALLRQVRVLEDYGEFETADGKAMILKKGSIHYLPITEIEVLIQQHILEEVA